MWLNLMQFFKLRRGSFLFALTSKSMLDLFLRDLSSLVVFFVKKFPRLPVGLDLIVLEVLQKLCLNWSTC